MRRMKNILNCLYLNEKIWMHLTIMAKVRMTHFQLENSSSYKGSGKPEKHYPGERTSSMFTENMASSQFMFENSEIQGLGKL